MTSMYEYYSNPAQKYSCGVMGSLVSMKTSQNHFKDSPKNEKMKMLIHVAPPKERLLVKKLNR